MTLDVNRGRKTTMQQQQPTEGVPRPDVARNTPVYKRYENFVQYSKATQIYD